MIVLLKLTERIIQTIMKDRMAEVAAEFPRKSNGLIRGAIGALDG